MTRPPTPTPRSFSHVSFYVSDVRRAAAFFLRECGLGLPRERPDQRSAFLSTGGNHHEVEIFEAAEERVSHIGIEYETESDLLAVAHQLDVAGVAVRKRSVVPGLIRSVFSDDPDGNGLHLFANLSSDWTTWRRGEAISETWSSDTVAKGTTAKMSLDSFDVVRDDGASHVARRFTGGVLASRNALTLSTFYTEVLGFTPRKSGGAADVIVLSGQRAGNFLVLKHAAHRSGLVELCFGIDGGRTVLLETGPADVSIRLSVCND